MIYATDILSPLLMYKIMMFNCYLTHQQIPLKRKKQKPTNTAAFSSSQFPSEQYSPTKGKKGDQIYKPSTKERKHPHQLLKQCVNLPEVVYDCVFSMEWSNAITMVCYSKKVRCKYPSAYKYPETLCE